METETKNPPPASSVRRSSLNFADEYHALDKAVVEYWRNRMFQIKAARAARGE